MESLLYKLEQEERETLRKLKGSSNNLLKDAKLRQQLKDVQKHIRWLKKEIKEQ